MRNDRCGDAQVQCKTSSQLELFDVSGPGARELPTSDCAASRSLRLSVAGPPQPPKAFVMEEERLTVPDGFQATDSVYVVARWSHVVNGTQRSATHRVQIEAGD